MRDGEGWFGGHDDGLGCDSAGPEEREFSCAYGNGIAEVRVSQVPDSKLIGESDVDRCAMDSGVVGGDLNCPDGIGGGEGTHRDDHVAEESACGFAGDGRFVHGDIAAEFDVTNGEAGSDQGGFKGEGTTDQETDEVVLPVAFDGRRFVGEEAVAPDTISGEVGPEI